MANIIWISLWLILIIYIGMGLSANWIVRRLDKISKQLDVVISKLDKK